MDRSKDQIEDLKPRAAGRVCVGFDALLRFDGRPELPVFILDFSSRGFQCRCSERLRIGSQVILHVPTLGQFSATIAWQLGVNAGARFDSPLPLDTLVSILVAVVQTEPQELQPDAPFQIRSDTK